MLKGAAPQTRWLDLNKMHPRSLTRQWEVNKHLPGKATFTHTHTQSTAGETPCEISVGDENFRGWFLSCLPKKLLCSNSSALEEGPSCTDAGLKDQAIGPCRAGGKSNARPGLLSPVPPHSSATIPAGCCIVGGGQLKHAYLEQLKGVPAWEKNSWPRYKELTEGEGVQKRGV